MPLAGKKILITRPVDQTGALSTLLRERHAEAVYFPTIQIVPPSSWDECDEAIDHYRTYDALIFTSVNAVKYFFTRAVERGLQPGLLPKSMVYVVGVKSAEAVASFGIAAARFPGVTNVRMLADALCAEPVLQKRFLFPKGNLAGSEITAMLTAQGAVVDEVTVYETAAGQGSDAGRDGGTLDADRVCAMFRSGMIDAVLFYSPSSVENFFAVVPQDALTTAAVAAIGTTTAESLHALSVPVHVMPAHPTTEELVAALDAYFP